MPQSRTWLLPWPKRALRFHGNNSAPKDAPAALVQSVAVAPVHHFTEQPPHGSNFLHQRVQLRKFFGRESLPAFRGPRCRAKSKEEFANLLQGKSQLARMLDNSKTIQRRGVVAPLPADPLGRGH